MLSPCRRQASPLDPNTAEIISGIAFEPHCQSLPDAKPIHMGHTSLDAAKILLIEDDEVDALLFQRVLANCTGRYELDVCVTLDSAIQWILNHQCDVVLLDFSLPDSFGIEGLRKLQSRFADLPVVMLTGLDDPQTSLDARESGAHAYVVKGQFDSVELDETLTSAIHSGRPLHGDQWRSRSRLRETEDAKR